MKLLKSRIALLGLALCGVPSMASAQLVYFDNQADFETNASGRPGNIFLGVETFEENNLTPFRVDTLNDPLESGVANIGAFSGMGFTNGLTGVSHLRIQSNAGGPESEFQQPQGTDGLALITSGVEGSTSDIVVASSRFNATDIIYTGLGARAIGGDLLAFSELTGTVRIDIFDENDVFLDRVDAEGDRAGTHFFGVVSDNPFTKIGRINVFQITGEEGMDNIQVWGINPVPEPCTLVALAAGILAVLRRRRQK
jgi:hypothetical protein